MMNGNFRTSHLKLISIADEIVNRICTCVRVNKEKKNVGLFYLSQNAAHGDSIQQYKQHMSA